MAVKNEHRMQSAGLRIYPVEKMERLYRGALRVLRETGCFIDHDDFLALFEKRRMKVDRTRRRVFFTEDLVNEWLGPDPGRGDDFEPPRSFPVQFGIGGSYPHYYDWPAGTATAGTTATMLDMVRTFNAMATFTTVGRILTLADVPQPIEPIIATALVIKHSPRPGRGEVYDAGSIPYLVELGEIVRGTPGCADFVPDRTFVTSPLRITRDVADLILAKAKLPIAALAGTMPSSGATAPVTREGTVVIQLAEVIATWLCYRAVRPDVSLGAVCASSVFDMKRGLCRFASPEAVLQDCAAAQILTRYFGVPARTSSGYVDAKTPGIQATYEKLFKAWWSYQFQGFINFGPGLLEAGQTFCCAQALVDMDTWESVNAMFTPEPRIEAEVPFNDIDIVAREGGTFLITEHTLSLFREIMYHPQFLRETADESVCPQAEATAGILNAAQARYDQVSRTANEYRAPDAICRAVDAVVQRARKAIL